MEQWARRFHEKTMSDHDAHGAAAHDDHGGHDDHDGHGGPALGPIDWKMWGVGLVGVAAAVVVVAGFVVATGFAFNA